MSDTPDVLVFRRGAHGMSSERYAEALREHLPEYDIVRARTPQEERERITDVTVATGHRFDESLLDHAADLELFACAAAGVEHLPLNEFESRGIAVTNASGVHGPNIAEHVLGNILVFSRNLHEGWRRQQRNEWRHYRAHPRELSESTLTVVGLGAIGATIVDRSRSFGCHIIGVRHSPEKGKAGADEVVGFDAGEFHTVLARTDYLVLACPLTETTRGLLDGEAFETLGPEAVVVNIGRGGLIETDALLDALRNNTIRGAALDVTDPEPLPADHELWQMNNVFITPHNAGDTGQYYPRLAEIVAKNLRRIEESGGYDAIENRVL